MTKTGFKGSITSDEWDKIRTHDKTPYISVVCLQCGNIDVYASANPCSHNCTKCHGATAPTGYVRPIFLNK